MNLSDYLRIFIRRGWIVLLAALLSAGSAYAFSRLQTPVYRATQAILIKPARNDLGLIESLKRLIASYTVRLNAELRAQEAIEALKLDMTPGQLADMVTAASDLNTLVINVDVDMTEPDVAARVARVYGDRFIEWRSQENQPLRLEDRISAELLDTPKPGLFRPNTPVNMLAGALLGLLLGGIIVFVLEFLEANIVRRSADVEHFLQLPVLGALPPIPNHAAPHPQTKDTAVWQASSR
jgi:capsular polysaccharide biosynthesis protein